MLFQKLSGKRQFTSNISPAAAKGLWASGFNYHGVLGLGDVVHRSSPVQVGTLSTWSSVSVGGFGLAVSASGTLWSWGYNAFGQLGLGIGGATASRSSPTQVGTLANWSTVSASGRHALATKTDNTLWSWGYNGQGALGLGAVGQYRSSPTQVGTLANWSQIVAAGNTTAHSLAIRTDGSLWWWGSDIAINSPTQVGTLTSWTGISSGFRHILGIQNTGTLWAWGGGNANIYGALGLGDRVNRDSPTQVGTLATWSKAIAGNSQSVAVKTDGTLWAWGGYGARAHGDTIFRSSPVQVGTLSAWDSVGGYHTWIAIKKDSTLWSWGIHVGDGTAVYRSSPVQIGTLATWVRSVLGSGNAPGFAALRV